MFERTNSVIDNKIDTEFTGISDKMSEALEAKLDDYKNNLEILFENIKGQKSGISFQYFLMLAGDDNYLKIDRWLLRFLKDATGIDFSSDLVAAHNIYIRACNELKVIYPNLNPRLYDHIIWLFMTK